MDVVNASVLPVMYTILSGGPVLMAHFLCAAAVVTAGIGGYMWVTPHHEIRLVQDGNTAAGIALAATIIGVVLPGAVCLGTGITVWDVALWCTTAVVLQILVFKGADLLLRDLAKRIEEGEMSAAAVLSAAKIGAGILLAAGLS